MDELERRRRVQRVVGVAARRLRRRKAQDGTNPLTASGQRVPNGFLQPAELG